MSFDRTGVVIGGFATFPGAWHHVAAVVDRKSQRITVYVDGAPVVLTSGFCGKSLGTTVSIEGCPFLAASSNDPLTIGSYRGSAEFFSGALGGRLPTTPRPSRPSRPEDFGRAPSKAFDSLLNATKPGGGGKEARRPRRPFEE